MTNPQEQTAGHEQVFTSARGQLGFFFKEISRDFLVVRKFKNNEFTNFVIMSANPLSENLISKFEFTCLLLFATASASFHQRFRFFR